jgi:opacity protein-like surface antigen
MMMMGSLKTLAVAGAAVIGVSTFAFAGDLPPPPPPGPAFDAPLRGTVSVSGLYLRGDIGVGVQTLKDFSQEDVVRGGGTFIRKDDSSTVAFGGIGVGYRFNNWFRFDVTGELRGSQSFSNGDRFIFTRPAGFGTGGANQFTVDSQSNSYRGNVSTALGMANAYVDLGTFCALGCLTPFLGAGVGFAQHKISGVSDQGIVNSAFYQAGTGTVFINSTPTLATANTNTRTNFAWALMAGVGYNVTPNVALEVGYRYLNMGQVRSGSLQNAFAAQTLEPVRYRTLDSHDIRIGMRWALNGGDCCGTPAPEPIYAPRPMVRKF